MRIFVHFGKDTGKYVVNYDWIVMATVMSWKHMCLMGQGWFSTSKLHHEGFFFQDQKSDNFLTSPPMNLTILLTQAS